MSDKPFEALGKYISAIDSFFATTYPCWIDKLMAKFRTHNGNEKGDLFSTPMAWLRKRELEIFKDV